MLSYNSIGNNYFYQHDCGPVSTNWLILKNETILTYIIIMIVKITLLITSFFTGAIILSYEILMIHMITPYFGSSHIIWANIIATVIIALAIGYKYGGTLADRYPNYQSLYNILILGCCLFSIAYIGNHTVCETIIASMKLLPINHYWTVFFASLIVSLLLFCFPIMLLGCCTPYIIRLLLTSMTNVGKISGLVYGISTIGSLAGLIVTSLIALPLLGLKTSLIIVTVGHIIINTITLGITKIK
ncbi:hypothetical protein DID74_02230 [Candidatus Marinamargulisbacteria bacterium SCGC AG-333-B06]|nr:hypothetical protein DID74_02230 [Candidatus Marinamargulisbacteria bacterium SCGC AG-333-B06]